MLSYWMWLQGFTLYEIGEIIGGGTPYGHATIINSKRKIEGLIDVNRNYKKTFESLSELFDSSFRRRATENYFQVIRFSSL